MRFYSILTTMVFFSALMMGCSKATSIPRNSNGDPIISEQFDPGKVTFRAGVPRFITLIQLKSPALLDTAQRDSLGVYTIDESSKQQVIEEQNRLEAELLKISPDIRVVFRYRMILNALAVDAPQQFANDINNLDVQFIEADERFYSPEVFQTNLNLISTPLMGSSMNIIGAPVVHQQLSILDSKSQVVPVKGKGIRVGIIDSGIDYTHSMLGGPGDKAVFESISPEGKTPFFPNSKVVGGYDFVGTRFNSRSHIYENRVPLPDENPIDKSGHGTHVAASVAGVGDGLRTYDGAAPEAELYALKVFGDGSGGTNDTAVIAALEYAADPNGDMNPDDRLHVVNLSLGGNSGKPHSLYNVAIKTLTKGGTLAVVSAGNEGAIKNIVGSPSTADEALSVAASVDDRDSNWQFPALEIATIDHPQLIAETIEGATTKSIATLGNIQGRLVQMGLAAVDFTPEQAAQLRGHIALIDRGEVSFDEKIQRAVNAGAIGVVTVNNVEGDPFRMGGEGSFEIPGVMISKTLGDLVKEQMLKGEATFQFVSSQKVHKPEIIDTLVGFSSQGPRTIDSLIKPEITAPGFNIISAAVGSGTEGTGMSGTSMASPHIAGAAALLFQYRPQLTALEVKSLLMNTSELVDDRSGITYPISRQGAGRAQVLKAATADILVEPAALSLGEIQVDKTVNMVKSIKVKNISDRTVSGTLTAVSADGLDLSFSQNYLSLAASESVTLDVFVSISPAAVTVSELDGFIRIMAGEEILAALPVMAVVSHLTEISLVNLFIDPSQQTGVTLKNTSANAGEAYFFQLLGEDERKPLVLDPSLSSSCDLESVGYRVVERDGGSKHLQLAAKLYNPITNWTVCDFNVEFDFNGDGISDREVIGTTIESIAGLNEEESKGLRSNFFESQKLRDIIAEYRKEVALQNQEPPGLNFKPALISNNSMFAFDHSTLAIVEVPLSLLLETGREKFDVRVSVTYNGGNIIEWEDVLNFGAKEWHSLSADTFIPSLEAVVFGSDDLKTVTLPSLKPSTLWIGYFPRNEFISVLSGKDNQSLLLNFTGTGAMP